ncbi:MAG: zinc ribbon domain-containing protein [Candidatus Brockarchaeota archaeon]|nr:zinc ribbon domain-containing protein [Candidatus Brockarchaeota archaeon]
MVSGEKRAPRAFVAVQSLLAVSAAIIALSQHLARLPPAVLIPFAVASTLLLPGFALTWAIEGPSIWRMGKVRILVWSVLLSFGLNFLLLFVLNVSVGMLVWQVLLLEQASTLFCSFIGYRRERRALREPGERAAGACPNCGEPVRPEDEFCTNCGVRLGAGRPENGAASEST